MASASVERAAAPGRVRRNVPDPVRVIVLSRLAVARKDQGRGLGAQLLRMPPGQTPDCRWSPPTPLHRAPSAGLVRAQRKWRCGILRNSLPVR